MKWLVGVLLLAGCASLKKSTHDVLTEELKTLSQVTGVLKAPEKALKAQAAIAAAPAQQKLIGLSATTGDLFLGWVKTSVGFVKGEVSEQSLSGLGLPGLPYSWRILKRWDDGTVRIGQFKTVGLFNGMGIVPVNLQWGQTPKTNFTWHPAVIQAVIENKFATDFRINLSANGVPLTCAPATGDWKILVADATEIQVRHRSHCVNTQTFTRHPLSVTGFFTIMADDPTVRASIVLGNDTREYAVGTINVSNITIQNNRLPVIQWVNEASFGNKSPVLADSQTMAFKTVMTFDPAFNSTVAMIKTGEPMGFQFWDDARASKAFGTAPIPATRLTLQTINSAHTQMNNSASFAPQANPNTYLGMVNRCPPDTGDQPGFTATMHLENQKAMQTYSSRKMASNLIALYRESNRPMFSWETRNGVEDRINVASYQNLFCWNGYCPHYDFSWNNSYPEWFSRTNNAGWNPGLNDRSGWCPHDNQHTALQPLRDAYEITGDPYLKDVLEFDVTMLSVAYFSTRWPSIEAERAFGRSVKDAIGLIDLFPDLPESQTLKQRVNAKKATYAAMVDQTIQNFGNPASVPFDANDPRVLGGAWGPTQNAYGHGAFVAVGWMQGFVNESMTLFSNPDLRVFNAMDIYFLQDGTPKTYFQLPTPSIYTTGGIGEWWMLSGAVALSEKYPELPSSQFARTILKPRLSTMIEQNVVNGFGPLDGWKNY